MTQFVIPGSGGPVWLTGAAGGVNQAPGGLLTNAAGDMILSVGAGSAVATGTQASLAVDMVASAGAGSGAATGTSTIVGADGVLLPGSGSAVAAGAAASLNLDMIPGAGAAAVTVSGAPSSVECDAIIGVGAGALAASGTQAEFGFSAGVSVDAAPGDVEVSGAPTSLQLDAVLSPSTAAVAISGAPAGFRASVSDGAGAGSAVIPGSPTSLSLDAVINPGLGAATIGGTPSAAIAGTGAISNPGAGDVSAVGQPVVVSADALLSIPAGSLSASGLIASLISDANFSVGAGVAVVTGTLAAIPGQGINISVGAGLASFAGTSSESVATSAPDPATGMTQSRIQVRINHGMGIAARYLGAPYGIYRASGPSFPLSHAVGWLRADFDIDPQFKHQKPSKYGNPIYYGLFDATQVLPGDYLTGGPMGTFFVGNMEPNKPPICIQCNRIMRFMRPVELPGSYAGDTVTNETIVMDGWPASLLQKSRGDRQGRDLPGDTRIPWYELLVPALPGVPLFEADRAQDENAVTYTLSSTEATDLGWRIMCEQAEI